VVGLRDRAIVAVLIYTAARAGAVATVRRGNLYHAGDQWMLHFDEKGGKREIPMRHDLERMLFEYIDAAGLREAPKGTPLFRTAYRSTNGPIGARDSA
jgi:integrase/recombinase XerD